MWCVLFLNIIVVILNYGVFLFFVNFLKVYKWYRIRGDKLIYGYFYIR